MKTSFEIKVHFNVAPGVIYRAFLDSDEHSRMTGGDAVCSDEVGGRFTAWDGYIFGKNITLVQDTEIVQHWRTTEFMDDDDDSHLRIKLRETANGCEVTLIHTNIPDGDADYEQGWNEYYFEPMKEYFDEVDY